MDIAVFRPMVEKNPKGFGGRYGLGNTLLQEEAICPKRPDISRLRCNWTRRMSPPTWPWAAPSCNWDGRTRPGRSCRPVSTPLSRADPPAEWIWSRNCAPCSGRLDSPSSCP